MCEALSVEKPHPAGSGYEYELPVKVVDREGKEASNFVDFLKEGSLCPRSQGQRAGPTRRAHAVQGVRPGPQLRDSPAGDDPAVHHHPRPREDDGRLGSLGGRVRWLRRGASDRSAHLHERPQDIALLRDIWQQPQVRNPRARGQIVTEKIAVKLARLASSLETRGYDQERVSRFLMRCVFTMFAEDVRLLQDEPFHHVIEDVALPHPEEFVPSAEELWRAMDDGAHARGSHHSSGGSESRLVRRRTVDLRYAADTRRRSPAARRSA